MNYDPGDGLLAAAFAAVRQYDPATYARMEASTWHLSRDPFDLSVDFAMQALVSPAEQGAEMVTVPDTQPGFPVPITWVNVGTLLRDANAMGVQTTLLAAADLVHEFAHLHAVKSNEQEAFQAGSRFAARLPAPDGPVIQGEISISAQFKKAHPFAYNPEGY